MAHVLSDMMHKIETDILIVGGGIVGLWLLRRLRTLGVKSLLIESGDLGGGQSCKSQGIIHGGMKYTLSGCLTPASQTIAMMPQRWQHCLRGEGDVDLSSAKVLCDSQYMWCPGGFRSKILGFFASKSLRSRVEPVEGAQRPEVFSEPAFKGTVYRLNEIVLDIPSVVRSLADGLYDVMLKAEDCVLQSKVAGGHVDYLQCRSGSVICKIKAKRYILAAGAGNHALLSRWGSQRPVMQRRPLHMVMVKHRYPHPVFAHCLEIDTVPRMTISSHSTEDGSWVWYLGGAIAESGVERDRAHQIDEAKKELSDLLPWVNLSGAQWDTLRVDRAEPANKSKLRPDTSFCEKVHNVMITWPTKLALTPQLTDIVIDELAAAGFQEDNPEKNADVLSAHLNRPVPCQPFWRAAFAT